MKRAFADTCYWIALIDKNDSLHQKAMDISTSLRGTIIYTSELVLVELANCFAARGKVFRDSVVTIIEKFQKDPNVIVIEQTSELFYISLDLFGLRGDKEWSLTDCSSMVIMEENDIKDILTYDHHFIQAKDYKALLRDEFN